MSLISIFDKPEYELYQCNKCGLLLKYDDSGATYLKPDNTLIIEKD